MKGINNNTSLHQYRVYSTSHWERLHCDLELGKREKMHGWINIRVLGFTEQLLDSLGPDEKASEKQ